MNVVVLFGGVSAEHEVSVITGLQVAENIDRSQFTPHSIYITHDGLFLYYPNLASRSDFEKIKGTPVSFGRDTTGAFFIADSGKTQKTYIDGAYFAFHGGNGESGQLQGFFESFEIPYTSSSVESSAIMMNKALTKTVLSQAGIAVIPGTSISSADVTADLDTAAKTVLQSVSLPVIIKPAHLGSSIGITIAKTVIELKKGLWAASFVDSEIVVEALQSAFIEYNCSVRTRNGILEASEIERPVSHDAILSFADKYERGGNKKAAGMASLARELPADITAKLKNEIQSIAKNAYKACRAKGLIRVDVMKVKNKLYVTEVNPIPGSMSFYLWEATGQPFRDQITDLINEALLDESIRRKRTLVYETDIVKKFISSKRR